MTMSTLTPKTMTPTTTNTTVIDRGALPKQIGYLVLQVSDMTKAIEFYKNTLGLALSHESATWCEISMGITLGLKLVDGTSSCSSSANTCSSTTAKTNVETIVGRKTGIAFNVVNVTKTYETMSALGVKILGEPMAACEGNHSFSFEDPFGNVFSAYGKK